LSDKIQRRGKARKGRYVEREQRHKQQRRMQRQVDEAVGVAFRQAIEQGLVDEVSELLGRAKHEQRDLGDATVVKACCNRCQVRSRREFYRAGFYSRGIVSFAVSSQIRVPRVSCICGGMVDFEFEHLEPYNRLWFDLEERARQLAGLCVSLRDSVEVLAWANGQLLAIATLNQRVNQTAELVAAFHQGEFERVPGVVMLDGVWLKVLLPTDDEYVDKQGRRRKRSKRHQFPLLVAYGVDPVSGERWVLDWERGESEDQPSWQRLLERLLERGLTAERGLRLFVHDGSAGLDQAFELVWFGKGVERQRCIFHKLRNVRRDVVGNETMSREQRRKRRQDVLADAAAVYRGSDEVEIRQRLAIFRAKWAEREPKAVATLERDFDQTLVYLRVIQQARTQGQEWRLECLRTTSPLERVQRHFRQKARQVVIAHSEQGLKTIIELVIRHRHLASPDQPTQPWSLLLEEALLAA